MCDGGDGGGCGPRAHRPLCPSGNHCNTLLSDLGRFASRASTRVPMAACSCVFVGRRRRRLAGWCVFMPWKRIPTPSSRELLTAESLQNPLSPCPAFVSASFTPPFAAHAANTCRLLSIKEEEWHDAVTVVASDMRTWVAPEKVCLVDEVCGSIVYYESRCLLLMNILIEFSFSFSKSLSVALFDTVTPLIPG